MCRFGSGQVNAPSYPTRPKPNSFFLFALSIAPSTEHLVLLAVRLKQAVLSLDKLSKKGLLCRIQETTTHIFFESAVEPLITKEEWRHKINVITSRIYNNLNCYYGNVLQSNNDSTKKIKSLSY